MRAIAARWTPRRLAGIAYLVPVANVAAVWYLLLFVAGRAADAGPTLRAWLVDDPQRAAFRWLAALPMVCGALSVAYLRAPGPKAAIALAALGIAVAAATWRLLDASIAATATLPLLFSVPAAIVEFARRGRTHP